MATQVGKLNYVDAKLGATTAGQQTTRRLFHTITTLGTQSSYTFFKNFQGLTNGQTNLTTNKLASMESMVIKTMTFIRFQETGELAYFRPNSSHVIANVIVGNQRVVKNLPLEFNGGNTGQAYDRLHAFGGSFNGSPLPATPLSQGLLPTEIRLLTDIVIPPQTEFFVQIESEQLNWGTGAIVCILEGYGKIFSAGNSF